MNEERAYWQKQYIAMQTAVDDEIKRKRNRVSKILYCAHTYEDDDRERPFNNLTDSVASGKVRFFRPFDSFWAIGGIGQDYFSEDVTDPTWLDVAVLADDSIHKTNNDHHILLEGVTQLKTESDGTVVYKLIFGS